MTERGWPSTKASNSCCCRTRVPSPSVPRHLCPEGPGVDGADDPEAFRPAAPRFLSTRDLEAPGTLIPEHPSTQVPRCPGSLAPGNFRPSALPTPGTWERRHPWASAPAGLGTREPAPRETPDRRDRDPSVPWHRGTRARRNPGASAPRDPGMSAPCTHPFELAEVFIVTSLVVQDRLFDQGGSNGPSGYPQPLH